MTSLPKLLSVLPFYRQHCSVVEQILSLPKDGRYVHRDSLVYLVGYAHATASRGLAEISLKTKCNAVDETWLGHSDLLTTECCENISNLNGVLSVTPVHDVPFATSIAKPDRVCIHIKLQTNTFDRFKECMAELNQIAIDMNHRAEDLQYEFQRRVARFPLVHASKCRFHIRHQNIF